MFVLAIKNILELLKFYMIGVWLFQVTGQKNKKMYIAVVIIFFFRMLYLGFRDVRLRSGIGRGTAQAS